MVTVIQFEITGNEILSFGEIMKHKSAISAYDTAKKKLPVLENNLKTAKDSLSGDENLVIAEHGKLKSKIAEIEKQAFDDWVQANNHLRGAELLVVSENYRISNSDKRLEICFSKNKDLEVKWVELKIKFQTLDEKIEDLLQLVKKHSDAERDFEHGKQNVEHTKNSLEGLKNNREQRISAKEIERLNHHIHEMNNKGWNMKSMEPLITGMYDSFGRTSEVVDGYNNVYPSGGYGCSFTHGFLIYWEMVVQNQKKAKEDNK